MLLNKVRQYSFWVIDFLKGRLLWKAYSEIKFMNENFFDSQVVKKRNEYLKEILNYSINNVESYNTIELNSELDSFPVINKNIIRDNFQSHQSKSYDSKKHKVSTSGSTGTPFTTFLSKNKKARNTSDAIYFADKSGFKLGDKLIYIRLWDKQHGKSKIKQFIQNVLPHSVVDLSHDNILKLLEEISNNKSPKGFLAYASAYDAICKYLDENNFNKSLLDSNVKSIIGISENLSEYAKISMKKYFGVIPVSRYSAVETGIVAQQPKDESYFVINWASYYVEIFDMDRDVTVEYGVAGRIVITDLFNHAVPMIRYDTGDIGTMILSSDNIPVLSKVEGRKMDMLYNTKGELLSSHIVHEICLFKGIKQYQLIQENLKNYRFKINATIEFTQKRELLDLYKGYLGDDAEIIIEYVTDVPLLSSGKRKKVVNLYY